MKTPKVMIVGLDAATWDLAKPWVAEGHMPNLARLMSEGTSGKFQSVLPPITPPAWTSFTTGKNPGKHGIFHFMETKPDSYALSYTNATSRRTRTVRIAERPAVRQRGTQRQNEQKHTRGEVAMVRWLAVQEIIHHWVIWVCI